MNKYGVQRTRPLAAHGMFASLGMIGTLVAPFTMQSEANSLAVQTEIEDCMGDELTCAAKRKGSRKGGKKRKKSIDVMATLGSAGLDRKAITAMMRHLRRDPNGFFSSLRGADRTEAEQMIRHMRAFQPIILKAIGKEFQPMVKSLFGEITATEVMTALKSLPKNIQRKHVQDKILRNWELSMTQAAKAFHGKYSGEARKLKGTGTAGFMPFDLDLLGSRVPKSVTKSLNGKFLKVDRGDLQVIRIPARMVAPLGFHTVAYHKDVGFGVMPAQVPKGIKGLDVTDQSFFDIVNANAGNRASAADAGIAGIGSLKSMKSRLSSAASMSMSVSASQSQSQSTQLADKSTDQSEMTSDKPQKKVKKKRSSKSSKSSTKSISSSMKSDKPKKKSKGKSGKRSKSVKSAKSMKSAKSDKSDKSDKPKRGAEQK